MELRRGAGSGFTHQMVRDGRTACPPSWPGAGIAADALAAAAGSTAVLVGGRLTAEDAQAYSTFTPARCSKTDDVSTSGGPARGGGFRLRSGTFGPTNVWMSRRPSCWWLSSREESPIVFLRLRRR